MGIGSQSLPAPQATLMSTIIKGLLSQNLPWGLVLVRRQHLAGPRVVRHPFALLRRRLLSAHRHHGAHLRRRRRPLGVERKTGVASESEISSGTLFSSGLIAGGSIAGILYAVLFGRNIIAAADDAATTGIIPFLHEGTSGQIAGGLVFLALAIVLARVGQRKLE